MEKAAAAAVVVVVVVVVVFALGAPHEYSLLPLGVPCERGPARRRVGRTASDRVGGSARGPARETFGGSDVCQEALEFPASGDGPPQPFLVQQTFRVQLPLLLHHL